MNLYKIYENRDLSHFLSDYKIIDQKNYRSDTILNNQEISQWILPGMIG